MSEEQNTPFITDKDRIHFMELGIDLDKAIPIFIKEICAYFNTQWQEQYYIKELPNTLEELNEKHLLSYPSCGGGAILDDSFTGPDCPVEMLSDNSKQLLAGFYEIVLR